MTDFSRFPPPQRVIQYRERARMAIDRASRTSEMRQGFLDLARSWNTLADALERELGQASSTR
jgi:hypothetical protein